MGSLLCDIDVTSSRSHRDVAAVTALAALAFGCITALELHFHLGTWVLLRRQTSLLRILSGLAAMLALCAFGMRQPHRSFMHSLPGLALLTALVWEVFPFLAPAFGLSMLSHILLDLLNRKGVRLLYPLRRGFCLKLCPSSGRVNDLLCLTGSAAAAAGAALSLWHIFC